MIEKETKHQKMKDAITSLKLAHSKTIRSKYKITKPVVKTVDVIELNTINFTNF